MKLSIITINLNNAPGLRKTIESVVNQNFGDYEYIVTKTQFKAATEPFEMARLIDMTLRVG